MDGLEERKDPILELVMSAQARVEGANREFQYILKKYKVVPVIVETRKGGQTVNMSIEWMPQESVTGPKPLIIQ